MPPPKVYHNPGRPDLSAAARRRRGVRPGANPATRQAEYTDAERAFMVAMDEYKREARRPYPACSEVLEVLAALGYRLAEPPLSREERLARWRAARPKTTRTP